MKMNPSTRACRGTRRTQRTDDHSNASNAAVRRSGRSERFKRGGAGKDAFELRRKKAGLVNELYQQLRARNDGLTLDDVLEDLIEAERILTGSDNLERMIFCNPQERVEKANANEMPRDNRG